LGKGFIVHRIRETTDIQFVGHGTSLKVGSPKEIISTKAGTL
jgi:hypothetical protein